MTPNDPQLRVDSINHYLPRIVNSDDRRDYYDAPERVWVPADTLPTVACPQSLCASDVTTCCVGPGTHEHRRPLAVGDRVSLVTDCETCSGAGEVWHQVDGQVWADQCASCSSVGVVRVGSATVTEIAVGCFARHGADADA